MTKSAKSALIALTLVCLLPVGLATGCGANNLKRANLLLDDVRGYHDGIRWERFSQAVLRIPPADRGEFLEERDNLAEDLRISDYEIVRVHYLKKDMRAEVVVRYMWHLDSRGIVHKTTAKEVWERRGKRWIVVKEARTRGEVMPGLKEPDPEDSEDIDDATEADEPEEVAAGEPAPSRR